MTMAAGAGDAFDGAVDVKDVDPKTVLAKAEGDVVGYQRQLGEVEDARARLKSRQSQLAALTANLEAAYAALDDEEAALNAALVVARSDYDALTPAAAPVVAEPTPEQPPEG